MRGVWWVCEAAPQTVHTEEADAEVVPGLLVFFFLDTKVTLHHHHGAFRVNVPIIMEKWTSQTCFDGFSNRCN